MTSEIQHYFTLFNDSFNHFETGEHDWFLNPVVTPTAIRDIRDAYQLTKDVATYNAVLDRVYKATLDFMTVSFAGRQTGRRFLLVLQAEMVRKTPLDYNNQVLCNILHQLNFKVSDFVKQFPFARASLVRSQRDFHSEKLSTLPTTFIYFEDDAVKIEHLPQSQIFAYLNQKSS
ncbi:thioredoxin domain-containing protein [Pseudolactococcus reticulitermitis]|uniref:Dithiol-disulfide isomerase n=1 Tax=Pseudolactococcus reticulitermitis TaxID=2025039 RepID=A0A224WXG7_9LACT|nr:DsbA family protein [Lactococcus reticulitermitis]GAX46968.1 hypothetical protein RsY01_548 [Lactococcus reticulitermitis]